MAPFLDLTTLKDLTKSQDPSLKEFCLLSGGDQVVPLFGESCFGVLMAPYV
jgi:hypothetical protein